MLHANTTMFFILTLYIVNVIWINQTLHTYSHNIRCMQTSHCMLIHVVMIIVLYVNDYVNINSGVTFVAGVFVKHGDSHTEP